MVAKIPGLAAFFKPIEKPSVCLPKRLANPLQPKYCRLCNLKRIDLARRAQSQHRRLCTPVVQGEDELLFERRKSQLCAIGPSRRISNAKLCLLHSGVQETTADEEVVVRLGSILLKKTYNAPLEGL